jgi:uncharacterized protein
MTHASNSIRDLVSRRQLLAGLGAAAALPLLTHGAPAAAALAQTRGGSGLAAGFVSVAESRADTVTVPRDYVWKRLIAWGDPLFETAASATPAARGAPFAHTRAEQEQRFGTYNDMLALFPQPYAFPWPAATPVRALMCVNHEAVSPLLCAPDQTEITGTGQVRWTGPADQMEALYAAMGVAVVQLGHDPATGDWQVIRDPAPGTGLNRRITPFTEVMFAGPARNHPWITQAAGIVNRLESAKSGPPRNRTGVLCGTMHNCAGGYTPWGTYLTAEENFRNQFFTSDPAAPTLARAAELPGMGFDQSSYRYGNRWPLGGPAQFDLSVSPHGPALYGWIVEIDPYDPDWTPRKRTALGRKQNECATTVITRDGRIAVYMGDDADGEFVYRFVSSRRFNPLDRVANRSLLDEGTLYVARFEDDATGRWIALTARAANAAVSTPLDDPFADDGDMLVRARDAARRLGATHMDRPEDVQCPAGPDFRGLGSVYVVCTGNTGDQFVGGNAANPRRLNADGAVERNYTGQVLRIDEDGGDHAADTFTWAFFAVGGDPSGPQVPGQLANGTPVNTSNWVDGTCISAGDRFGSPDNIAFDRRGYAWITTDGTPDVFPCNDGVYVAPLGTGEGPRPVKRFLTAPVGAEVCGPFIAPGERTFFCAIQHPGHEGLDGLPWRGGDDGPPSTFPDNAWPRDAVIVVRRIDGGIVGT